MRIRDKTAVDERVDQRTVPGRERFSHFVDKLTEAMVMGTPRCASCARCGCRAVPLRSSRSVPDSRTCQQRRGRQRGRGRVTGRPPPRSCRPSHSRTHSGLAGARGVWLGALFVPGRPQRSPTTSSASPATTSRSRGPAPARRPSRCRRPPSSLAAGIVDRIIVVARPKQPLQAAVGRGCGESRGTARSDVLRRVSR